MKKENKRKIKWVIVFSIIFIWSILKIIAYTTALITIYQFVALAPTIKDAYKNKQQDRYVEMPENCKEIYDMFQNIEYESMEISEVYMNSNITTVVFTDKTEERANYNDINDVQKAMSIFAESLKESQDVEMYCYDLKFNSLEDSGLVYFYEITNFVDVKSFPGLRNYSSTGGVWISQMDFNDWEEMEEYFYYAEGIVHCSIKNMDGVFNVDPSVWENLEYLNVSYGGEDAEIYEEELKRLFPDCEISLE